MPAEQQEIHKLVQSVQGMVRQLAVQIHARMPGYLELDDLVSYGQLGLMQAARDFRPELGHKFTTFAYYRIRGAIYDGAIKMSWMNRSWHRHSQFSCLADEFLQNEDQEAGSGDPRESDLNWLQRVAGSLTVIYLSTQARGEASGDGEVTDEKAESPQAILSRREVSVQLRHLVDQLTPDSAQLIRLVYFEDLTLQEAGVRLGISKSWASRLHARALEHLARGLRDLDLAL